MNGAGLLTTRSSGRASASILELGLRPPVATVASFPPWRQATQGQMDVFSSQLPYKCHQNRVTYVGDGLKIFSWVTSRVV